MRLRGSGWSQCVNVANDTDIFRVVVCPRCQGDSVYAPSNPYRPFCGQRCKAADFGAWADEGFRIAPGANEGDDDLPQTGAPVQ